MIQQIGSGDSAGAGAGSSAGAAGLNKSGIFVERRSWTLAEKQIVVAEAFSEEGNVSAVAKRYGIQCQQIYRWRDRLSAVSVRKVPDFISVDVEESGMMPRLAPPPPSEKRCALVKSQRAAVGDSIEISLPGGLLIRVPAVSGPDFVAEIALSLSRSLT